METQGLELKAKLYQKLWAVMGEVDRVSKDGTVAAPGANYKYASEAAIKEAVHPALVKHRLVFMPVRSRITSRQTDITKNKYGDEKKQILTTIRLQYRFVDIDTGYSEDFELHGDGQDSGDKGIYKAFTGCFKYIFHMGLVIPTGDDPEKEEPSKEEKKQMKAEARSEQQAIAERKIAQIQAGDVPTSWDWRIALPRYESYEKRFGKDETLLALKTTGLNSIEDTRSQEHALEILEKVKARLTQSTDTPGWVDKPHAKPESTLEKASGPVGRIACHIGPAKPSDPVQEMLERMRDFKSRLAVIQQHKFDLVQKYGQRDGERRYYEVLDKQGGHPDTHANEIAKNADKSRATASELYLELHPETVEEEVTA